MVNARLQKEFGLYPRGDSDPFGDAVWESDWWCVQISMVREDDERPWRGGVGMSAWMRNPYLADMMAKRPKPKLLGFDADWRDFARDWEDFQLFLEQACPGEVPNFLLLELLHDCLDETSQRRLSLRRTEEPHLHFVEFGRQLESEFGRDRTTHDRDKWERLTLGGDGKLTVADWRNFQSKFEFALGRVEDATETEMERKILVELPGK